MFDFYDWNLVFQIVQGKPELVAVFKHGDDACEYLRTDIDSGYVSKYGRMIDHKNLAVTSDG